MMKHTMGRLLAAALVPFLGSACAYIGNQDANLAAAQLEPVALSGHLMLLDRARDRILVPETKGDKVSSTSLDGDASVVAAHPGGEAMVLLHGDQEVLELMAEPGKSGKSYRYDLKSAFSAMVLTPDGERAIVYHDPAASSSRSALGATNAGEMAVVDLTRQETSENPKRRTIHAGTAGILGVDLAPVLEDSAAGKLRLALLRLSGRLAILDLDHPGWDETLVLLSPGGVADVRVRQVRFEAATRPGGELVAHVLLNGSGDLHVLTITPLTQGQEGRVPVAVSINAHAVGVRPVDVWPFAAGQEQRPKALVASEGRYELHLVDLENGLSEVKGISSSPTALLHFEEGSADHPGPTVAALTSGRDLILGSLPELADGGVAKLRTTRLSAAPSRLVECPGTSLLLATYAGLPDAAFIDLDRSDQVIPLGLPNLVQDMVVDKARGLLLLLDQSEPSRLILVSLADLHPEMVELEFKAESMHLLDGADRLAVLARSGFLPEGAVSFIPHAKEDVGPEDVRTHYGLSLWGLLDRGPEADWLYGEAQ